MAATLADVLAETQKQTTLVGSLQTFVSGLGSQISDLRAQIIALGGDPAQVQAILDALTANDAVIQAISTTPAGNVVANPPAGPANG